MQITTGTVVCAVAGAIPRVRDGRNALCHVLVCVSGIVTDDGSPMSVHMALDLIVIVHGEHRLRKKTLNKRSNRLG